MSQKTLKDLILDQFEANSRDLPVFNRVALELQKMKRDESVSMQQIADTIMKDQSLAGRILQVANSSFYGGLKQVETISQAVIRLGMDQVAGLAMAASQAMAHKSKVKIIADHMETLWAHTFTGSVGARWIAIESGNRDRAEEAFLATLLHDIGELFLLKVLEKLMTDPNDPLRLTEPLMLEILESMHTEMGYKLMLAWELPGIYAVIARDHHLPDPDPSNELLLMTRLLDLTCLKLGIGHKAVPDLVLAATPEAQILGLKEIKLAQLEVMMEDKIEEVSAMVA